MTACDSCVRRTWLLERLSGYLEFQRRRVEVILSFEDQLLIDCWLEIAERKGIEDDLRREYERFGAAQAEAMRLDAAADGLELVCLCEAAYPERVRRLFSPPAVLHVAGGMRRFLELAAADPVAIVGTRRPTLYGTDVARLLGRGASVSGLSVVSGMAAGVDAAAHRGALAGGGRTIAVLPGCAAVPYPKTNQQLYRQILRNGVAISELGAAAPVRKWTLIARNRIVAALAELTVVVQGRTRSGALRTAEFAQMLGCRLGAVPGSVLVPQSEGPHDLLLKGAALIRSPQDVLDAVCGVGERALFDPARSGLSDAQRAVFAAIRGGADTVAALDRAGSGGGALLMVLAELELAGCVRRATGGRYVVVI
ncbi:MAG: DNA-protecting protein DprA [Acidobacteriota bacterium]|nr:DNA-protecting protein DprA [Acidobacteriota bacterium]